jgi:VCBS repeat-containing protein
VGASVADVASGTVVEKGGVANGTLGVATASGSLTGTFVVQDDAATSFGRFSIDAAGVWTYTLNDDNADVQALRSGGRLHDLVTVTTAGGASKVVDITIRGANDAAVITGTASDSVIEKGGVANGTAGDATASGDLDASDVDSAATFVVQTNATKSYGSFSIDATGAWSYTLNDGKAAVQALNVGDTLHELVTVKTADGTSTVVDIAIEGVNDAAVITGTATDTVREKGGVANGKVGNATAGGNLNAIDVDSAATFVTQTAVATAYGTFSIDATGLWTYTLDDDNAAVQALAAGGTLHDLVTVTTADGTSKVVDVTIQGANDTATITGTAEDTVTEKGGVANGTPGDATASGDLDVTDIDGAATFVVQADVAKSYGTFSIDETGAWSYVLDDGKAAVQALNGAGRLHELVTVKTSDGTSRVVDITIKGANDDAVITGTATDRVREKGGVANGQAGAANASGNLNATDVDNAATFVVQTNATKSYGVFSIDATGLWSYVLDDSKVAVQALNLGDRLHELVTVKTADGTSKVIEVTIEGANDAAVITGTATDRVREKGGVANGQAGAATASGNLNATDVDNAATFVVQTDVVGIYGTFSIDATGLWSYVLDDGNADVQALNIGGTLHEHITVATADGTSTVIDVRIEGANDAAVITGTASDTVIEKGGIANGTAGEATASGDLDATDIDSAATFVAQTDVSTAYGTFSIDAAGTWTYTLDDGNADVQALNAAGTLHDLITVATADGTSKVIDITVEGANDVATITGTAAGSVTEKSGVSNGTAGVATASGDLDVTDVDNAATFVVQNGVAKTYGIFSIAANGNWSYTLNDGNTDVQALNVGDTLHELVTVATADGTTQVVDVTIEGANDAPTIATVLADATATIGAAFDYIVPAQTASDVDGLVAYSAAVAGGGALPSWLSFDAATRTFSGTPAAADETQLQIVLTATDDSGASVSTSFFLAVAPAGAIIGTSATETLAGTPGDDSIFGLAGNDTVNAGFGHDKVFGAQGADTLNGDAGDDALYGDVGSDTLNGGAGADELHGGDNGDSLNGGTGDDELYGDAGNDGLNDGDGNDQLEGGEGDDGLTAGAGSDTLVGGNGNDFLSSQETGGTANLRTDYLYGGAGDDAVQAYSTYDRLYGYGGDGNDTFYLYSARGPSRIAAPGGRLPHASAVRPGKLYRGPAGTQRFSL